MKSKTWQLYEMQVKTSNFDPYEIASLILGLFCLFFPIARVEFGLLNPNNFPYNFLDIMIMFVGAIIFASRGDFVIDETKREKVLLRKL